MKTKIIVIVLLVQSAIFAQNNTVVSGGSATGSNGNATYSIGQINYQTNSNSTVTISQGVQQAFEIITLSSNDIPQIQVTAMVYPNPTVQNVTLIIKEIDISSMNYQLFDSLGRIVSSGKITENETEIEMTSLASAHYFLKISDRNTDIKTFKIIKK